MLPVRGEGAGDQEPRGRVHRARRQVVQGEDHPGAPRQVRRAPRHQHPPYALQIHDPSKRAETGGNTMLFPHPEGDTGKEAENQECNRAEHTRFHSRQQRRKLTLGDNLRLVAHALEITDRLA